MVKPDPAQDYYAALDVPSTSSIDDIKKRYRKLALLHHPDRNPGKELEAAARFQPINAAYEILKDPEQRQKYDLSRSRGNLHNSSFSKPAPPPKRNPFPSTTTWDPPPRRGDPRYAGPRPDGPQMSAGNGGAQRYARFPNPPPQAPNTSSKQDAKARANMFNAWQSMNNANRAPPTPGAPGASRPAHNVPPPYSGPRPKPAHSPPDDGPQSRPMNDGAHMRSAFEETRRPSRPNIHHTTSTTNAGRYAPRSADSKDPPSPYAHAQYNRAHPPRMEHGFAPAPPPRAPTAKRQEPTSHFRSRSGEDLPFADNPRDHPYYRARPRDQVPFAESNRERTPYMSHSNEKTYFDSDALRRTASVKDATKIHTQQAANGSNDRPRSASITRPAQFKPYMVYSSDEDSRSKTSSKLGSSPATPPIQPETRQTKASPKPADDPHATPSDGPADELESQQHPEHDAMDIDPPDDTAASGLSMNDLGNVAPLSAEPAGGINNLDDLSTNLPHPSQSSSQHPNKTSDELESPKSDLPRPPKPPLPPSKLTAASWNYYLMQMTHYMSGWNAFNAKMIGHFQDRAIQNQDREKGPAGGMVEGWLGAVGETEQLGGWDTYVRTLEEDERVRAHWNIACEKHHEAIGRHGNLRAQILKGGLAA